MRNIIDKEYYNAQGAEFLEGNLEQQKGDGEAFTSEPPVNALSFEYLYRSMYRCIKGVLWKDSAASFFLHGIKRTMKLEREGIKLRSSTTFTIYHPKKREILSVSFVDRVQQRALNDFVIYPAMTKGLIFTNFACQKKKGTDLARGYLKTALHRAFMKHGQDFYVLKIDIKGYYPSMSHKVVREEFRKHLDDYSYSAVDKLIRLQYEQHGETHGFNPGSQLIQIAGISVLSPLDHFIKEKLHVREYLVYMDDRILISNSKEQLQSWLTIIETKLNEKDFSINKKKTKITKASDGVLFLGFRYRVTSTGKVLMHPESGKVKDDIRAIRGMKRKGCSQERLAESFKGMTEHLSKGNAYHVIKRLIKIKEERYVHEENC